MLAFDRPDPRYRYTDRWGAYAVVFDPGRGLLLVETPDRWELPGGGIEEGESPAQALEREIWEETGHRLRTATPFVTVRQIWTRPDKGTFFNKICTVFLASVEGPLQAPTLLGRSRRRAGAHGRDIQGLGDRSCLGNMGQLT